jgi:hypothetical protein
VTGGADQVWAPSPPRRAPRFGRDDRLPYAEPRDTRNAGRGLDR